MVYRLKQNYVLRGWNKMAWVLVHRPENSCRFLRAEEFQVLLLCDGTSDFNMEQVTDQMQDILRSMEEEGIIEAAEGSMPLEEDQYYCYYDNRFVRSVFWSVTGRCNYRCRHCYMDAPEAVLGELSHEQALELIDQMAECGVLCVYITGGEPFIRKDFWELVDRILSYKMTIGQIYTNGWLLDDTVMDEFEKRNLHPEFSISFDGAGWHDWMRGVKGAEEAAVRALRLCRRRGFPVNVEMCVHRGNQDTLRETVALLAEIGVPAMKAGNVMKTELWNANSDGNALNIREYTNAMLRYIPYFFMDGMPMKVILSGVVELYKDSKDYRILPVKFDGTEKARDRLLCGVARYTCYITPEGRFLPCMPMTACKEQEMFPLVQDIGLKQGLCESFYMEIVDSRIKDLLAVNQRCASCGHKYQCGGGCRAIALGETGDLMGCDSGQCLLWEEGYVDRIREAAETAVAKYCRN